MQIIIVNVHTVCAGTMLVAKKNFAYRYLILDNVYICNYSPSRHNRLTMSIRLRKHYFITKHDHPCRSRIPNVNCAYGCKQRSAYIFV